MTKTDSVTAFSITAVRMNADGSKTLIVQTTYEDGSAEEHQLFPLATRRLP